METVTKEQAEKIEELGIKIESFWSWVNTLINKPMLVFSVDVARHYNEGWKAPTAEEMLDRMPSQIEDYSHNQLKITRIKDMYHVQYSDEFTGSLLYLARNKSLSEAVGDMFIWCAENGHLEANAQAE